VAHQQNVKQCVSENQTLKPERALEQDITVAIQDLKQKHVTGLVVSGKLTSKLLRP
jgi:uncharacterized protein involved in type VI secretion and phage assembly